MLYVICLDPREVSNIASNSKVTKVLNSFKEDFGTAFDFDHMVFEKFNENDHIVHADHHHSPRELIVLIGDKRFDLKHILGLLIRVKLQQVAVVGLHVGALLLLFLRIHRKEVFLGLTGLGSGHTL